MIGFCTACTLMLIISGLAVLRELGGHTYTFCPYGEKTLTAETSLTYIASLPRGRGYAVQHTCECPIGYTVLEETETHLQDWCDRRTP